MKLSNFEIVKVAGGTFTPEYFAEVDVTTGMLWWKKTVRRQIHRKFADFWHFVDNGEFTPGFEAEKMERAAKAQGKMP
jgi:hypothetical protein